MKLIRLTDDRFILDVGTDYTPARVDEVADVWKAWWATRGEDGLPPGAFVIGGVEVPIEYEDRREPDIESRLRAIEKEIKALKRPHSHYVIQHGKSGLSNDAEYRG